MTLKLQPNMMKEIMDVNLQNAASVHLAWLNRLELAILLELSILNDGHEMNPENIARDDRCDLGKWIHGAGKKYSGVPAFETLRQKHSEFHLVAARVATKVLLEDKPSAQKFLNGELQRRSLDTVNAIRALKKDMLSASQFYSVMARVSAMQAKNTKLSK